MVSRLAVKAISLGMLVVGAGLMENSFDEWNMFTSSYLSRQETLDKEAVSEAYKFADDNRHAYLTAIGGVFIGLGSVGVFYRRKKTI